MPRSKEETVETVTTSKNIYIEGSSTNNNIPKDNSTHPFALPKDVIENWSASVTNLASFKGAINIDRANACIQSVQFKDGIYYFDNLTQYFQFLYSVEHVLSRNLLIKDFNNYTSDTICVPYSMYSPTLSSVVFAYMEYQKQFVFDELASADERIKAKQELSVVEEYIKLDRKYFKVIDKDYDHLVQIKQSIIGNLIIAGINKLDSMQLSTLYNFLLTTGGASPMPVVSNGNNEQVAEIKAQLLRFEDEISTLRDIAKTMQIAPEIAELKTSISEMQSVVQNLSAMQPNKDCQTEDIWNEIYKLQKTVSSPEDLKASINSIQEQLTNFAVSLTAVVKTSEQIPTLKAEIDALRAELKQKQQDTPTAAQNVSQNDVVKNNNIAKVTNDDDDDEEETPPTDMQSVNECTLKQKESFVTKLMKLSMAKKLGIVFVILIIFILLILLIK